MKKDKKSAPERSTGAFVNLRMRRSEGMIKLCQFPSLCKDARFASPFCLRVETYLRLAELPYEIEFVLDPRKAPGAKLPYIVDQNQTIGDASLIIEHLKCHYGNPLDGNLTRDQMHTHARLEREIDQNLLWVLIYSRWIDEQGWQVLSQALTEKMPEGICHAVPKLIRARVRRELEAHGLETRSPDKVYAQGILNLQTLEQSLGSKKYLLGDTATTIDASAFAVLANILYVPFRSPLSTALTPSLQNYVERIAQSYFPERQEQRAA